MDKKERAKENEKSTLKKRRYSALNFENVIILFYLTRYTVYTA